MKEYVIEYVKKETDLKKLRLLYAFCTGLERSKEKNKDKKKDDNVDD